MAKKWSDIKYKKDLAGGNIPYILVSANYVDELSYIKEQANNMEITLDIIKSLADVCADGITEINRVNILFAIKKFCEAGRL